MSLNPELVAQTPPTPPNVVVWEVEESKLGEPGARRCGTEGTLQPCQIGGSSDELASAPATNQRPLDTLPTTPTLAQTYREEDCEEGFPRRPRHSAKAATINTPFAPNSSMSTTYESSTPFRPTADDPVTAPQGSYFVTIFGFTTLGERRSAVEQFLTESAKDDSSNGGTTLLTGDAYPSQEPSPGAFAAYESRQQLQTQQMPQPPLTPAPLGGNSTRAVRLKPSASAFSSNATITSTSAPRVQQPVDEWGLADKAKQIEGGAVAQQPIASGGFFGSVKNAVLGW
ncbi:hypothetical protein FRC01_010660 [Tulasnella sp. 417]|nr:hypothetical protein FRC01_010660 [Tulasnella sp. 417]